MSRRAGAMITLAGLGRGLVAVATLGAMVFLAWATDLDSRDWRRDQTSGGGTHSSVAKRLIVYRLDRARPTVFRYSQPVRLTRIISQPILAPGSASPGESWAYAIKADLLDATGAVIESREIHSRTLAYERDGTRRGARRYYRDSNDLIAPGDEVRIGSDRPFAAIRLTSSVLATDMVGIDVRVGEQRPLIASAAESAFVRLSPDDRRRLAGANAFPVEMLTREERIAIAVNNWRPVGPIGIDGRDYHVSVIYEEGEDAGGTGAASSRAEGGR